MKIYQCFYKNDQENLLDKYFEKLDNTENLFPELREYYINKICYNKAIKEKLDLWGCFSINYKSKMNISGKEILNTIKKNEGYDIYFFNPYYNISAPYYNVWENLCFDNKETVKILEKVFPMLKIDLKNLYEPMNTDEMFYCCYFVAKKIFWDGYNEIFSEYFEKFNTLDEETKKKYNSSMGYYKDKSLCFFPFMHERFFSSYTKIKNFKTFAFHYDDKRKCNNEDKKLDQLKKDSILEKNKFKLKEWINKRSSYYKIKNEFVHMFYENINW